MLGIRPLHILCMLVLALTNARRLMLFCTGSALVANHFERAAIGFRKSQIDGWMRRSELYPTTHVPLDGSDARDVKVVHKTSLRRNDRFSQISATYRLDPAGQPTRLTAHCGGWRPTAPLPHSGSRGDNPLVRSTSDATAVVHRSSLLT